MAISIHNSSYFLADSIPIDSYPFAITGWFRVLQGGQSTPLAGFVNDSPEGAYSLIYAGNSDESFIVNAKAPNSAVARTTSPMVVGQWHYLTANFINDTYREAYLDGGNQGLNTANRSFVGADTFYIGNNSHSVQIEIAELAVTNKSIADDQVSQLAKGFPILSTQMASHVVAYYDFVRNFNSPGIGPRLASQGTPLVTAHPRVFKHTSASWLVIPDRLSGPWYLEQSSFDGCCTEVAQPFVSGAESTEQLLSGEVVS